METIRRLRATLSGDLGTALFAALGLLGVAWVLFLTIQQGPRAMIATRCDSITNSELMRGWRFSRTAARKSSSGPGPPLRTDQNRGNSFSCCGEKLNRVS